MKYDRIEALCKKKGYSDILLTVLEEVRQSLKGSPKTTENAKPILGYWWENEKEPRLKEHEPAYFLVWHLKKELGVF